MMLVDTSVWIDYLACKPVRVVDYLDSVPHSELATCGVVQAELLPFIEGNELLLASQLLTSIRYLKHGSDKELWLAITHQQRQLCKAGLPGVGIPDLVIMHLSALYGVPVLSLDKHFAFAAQKGLCKVVRLEGL